MQVAFPVMCILHASGITAARLKHAAALLTMQPTRSSPACMATAASAPAEVRRELCQRDQRDGHRAMRRLHRPARPRPAGAAVPAAAQARVYQRTGQWQQHRPEERCHAGRERRPQQQPLHGACHML